MLVKPGNLFISFILLLLVIPAVSNACWPLKERTEIDGFAELDGVLILSFKDALNCNAVVQAKVLIGDLEYTTDGRGYLKLPMEPFAAMMDARAPLKIIKSGYITLDTELVVEAGTVLNRRMVLSPALPAGKARFVLQWDDEPEDLDLHLTGPGFHISYRNMQNAPNRAQLDQDETNGYGPETITLQNIRPDAAYALYVDNYSGDDNFHGTERIQVYSGNHLLREIRLPRTGQRAVKILDITQGQFQFVNAPSPRP